MEDFKKSVRADRTIDVYVGSDKEYTLQIPSSVLANISKCLANKVKAACKRADSEDNQNAHLSSQDTTTEAWETMLFWAYKRKLPPSCKNTRRLIDSWILGDRSNVPEFQDLIMLDLLKLDSSSGHYVADIEHAFNSAKQNTNPHLERLMAEVVLYAVEVAREFHRDEFEECWTNEGFTREIMKAYSRFHKYGKEIFDRFGEEEVSKEWWKKFMIGDGPKEHWVHEKVARVREKKRRRVE